MNDERLSTPHPLVATPQLDPQPGPNLVKSLSDGETSLPTAHQEQATNRTAINPKVSTGKLGVELTLPKNGSREVPSVSDLEVGISNVNDLNDYQVVTAHDEHDELVSQLGQERQRVSQLGQDRHHAESAFLAQISSLKYQLSSTQEENKAARDLLALLTRQLDEACLEIALQKQWYSELQDLHDSILVQTQLQVTSLQEKVNVSEATAAELKWKLDEVSEKGVKAQADTGEHPLACDPQLVGVQGQLADARDALNIERAAREALLARYEELVSQQGDLARHTEIIPRHGELTQRHKTTAQVEQHASDFPATREDIDRHKREEGEDRTGKALEVMEIAGILEAECGVAVKGTIAHRESLEDAREHSTEGEAKGKTLAAAISSSTASGITTEEVGMLRAQLEEERIAKELCMAECAELRDQVEVQKSLLKLKEVTYQVRTQVTRDMESEVVDDGKMGWYQENNYELARERDRLMQELNEARSQRDELVKKLGRCGQLEDNGEDDTIFEIPDCTAYESLFNTQPPFPLHDCADDDSGYESDDETKLPEGSVAEFPDRPSPRPPIPLSQGADDPLFNKEAPSSAGHESLLGPQPLSPPLNNINNPDSSVCIPDLARSKSLSRTQPPIPLRNQDDNSSRDTSVLGNTRDSHDIPPRPPTPSPDNQDMDSSVVTPDVTGHKSLLGTRPSAPPRRSLDNSDSSVIVPDAFPHRFVPHLHPPSPLRNRTDTDTNGKRGNEFISLQPDPGGGGNNSPTSSSPSGLHPGPKHLLKSRFPISDGNELRKAVVLTRARMHPLPKESPETS